MKHDQIALKADPEDFDASQEALTRALRARLVRRTKHDLGLSQTEFARRFHVPLETLRDWEQARSKPPDYAVAYVKVIARHPELVAELAAA